jgi:hypothetical protein
LMRVRCFSAVRSTPKSMNWGFWVRGGRMPVARAAKLVR